jgi:monoamine oxidase
VAAVDRSADVVVIGAGVAGLVAATAVRAAGRSVVVLEARADRVGGRTESVLVDGERFDLGATWIGAGHRRARALAGELGLRLVPTFSGGRTVIAEGGRLLGWREYALRHAAREWQLRRAWRRFEQLADSGAPGVEPWRWPDAERLDGETLDSWLRRTLPAAGARRVMRGTTANILGADAEQVSLLHALYYVRANGGVRAVLDVEGGAQQDMVEGGLQSLAERLAERLGDAVVLGAPVRAVDQRDGSIRAHADGTVVDARAAVVALPPPLAARIAFSPALPSARDQLAQRMPMGDVLKLVAVYDAPFWRTAGISADTWGGDLPYSFSADVGGPAGTPGAIAVFFVGADARAARALGPGGRAEAVTRALGRCLGERARRPRTVLERDWAGEEWTRGAYAGYMTPGGWTAFGDALREPCGALSFAGSETADDGIGYVEGAIASGERAAAEALARVA